MPVTSMSTYAGSFEDVTTLEGVCLNISHAFASTLTDLDGDGWSDLAVAAESLTRIERCAFDAS